MPRRLTTFTAFLASLACTVLAALAFANNVSVLVRWRAAFVAAGGDADAIPRGISGAIPWLDWSAVDYSCVSTFIPFLGFLLFTVGLLRIIAGRRADPAHFPFFPSYDQLNVALGLVGTLWGIILIGYYDMETVSMASLMVCLHTALFSTLVAVVWVFLVSHPILVPLARRLLRESDLAVEEDDRGLEDLLDDLRAAADGVGAILAGEEEAARGLSASIGETARGLSGFAAALADEARALAAREQAADALLERRLAALEEAHGKALDGLAATAATYRDDLRASAKAAAEETAGAVREALAAIAKARAEADAALATAIEARLKSMDEAEQSRRRAFDDALSRRLAEADAAQAERERKFDEILRERLARLAEESSANALRAEKAETSLARIRAAFE